VNAFFLGVGGALVLALLTALVGPHLVDWTAYRSWFEREAGGLLGVPVTVGGAVDLELLPAPILRFENVTVGRAGGPSPQAHVGRFTLHLAPTAFLRGEVRATEVHLDRPTLDAVIGEDGRLSLPLPAVPTGADADRTSLEQVVVSDGQIRLLDRRSGAQSTIDALDFTGEARSLAGPYKAEGRFRYGAVSPSFRVATARVENGALRLKASLLPQTRALSLDIDGALGLGPAPGFEGRLVAARAPSEDGQGALPWRLEGRLKADAGQAVLEGLELGYGPEDRRAVLNGAVRRSFGPEGRLVADLSARRLDLDRLPSAEGSLAAKFADLVEAAPLLASPPANSAVNLDVGGLVVGGGVISNIEVALSGGGAGWKVARAQAVLPGTSPLRFEGDLDLAPDREKLAGDLVLSSASLPTLRNWAAGFSAAESEMLLAPTQLEARTKISVDRQALVLDDVDLGLGGERLSGRFALRSTPGSAGRSLEMRLTATSLDLDALLGPQAGREDLLGLAELPAGLSAATVALNVEQLKAGGIEARGLAADLELGGGALELERLSVADVAGAALEASGRLERLASAPEGVLALQMKADDLTGLVRLASRYDAGKALAAELAARQGAIAPLDLRASLALHPDGAGIGGRFSVAGSLGGSQIEAGTSFSALTDAPPAGQVEGRVAVTNPSVTTMLAQLGLPVLPVAGLGEGQASVQFSGRVGEELRLGAQVEMLGTRMSARGALDMTAGLAARRLQLELDSADLNALGPALGVALPGAGESLPARMSGELSATAGGWSLRGLSGEIAGARLRGDLDLKPGPRPRLDGALEASDLDLEALAAFGLGGEIRSSDAAQVWSAEPFGAPALTPFEGAIRIVAERAALAPGILLQGAMAEFAFAEGSFALREVQGALGPGTLSGALEAREGAGTRRVAVRARLEGGRIENFVPHPEGVPVAEGSLALAAEIEGEGRSLSEALAGATGGGSLTLDGMRIGGLDAAAFGRIVAATQDDLDLQEARVREGVARDLAAGSLEVERAEAAFAVTGGVLRLRNLALENGPASALASARLDLRTLQLEGELLFSSKAPVDRKGANAPPVSLLLRGPLQAPDRTLDVGALYAFLTGRAIEREIERLEAVQADINERQRFARELVRLGEERRRREREAEEALRLAEEQRLAEEAARLEAERLMAPSGDAAETAPPPGGAPAPPVGRSSGAQAPGRTPAGSSAPSRARPAGAPERGRSSAAEPRPAGASPPDPNSALVERLRGALDPP